MGARSHIQQLFGYKSLEWRSQQVGCFGITILVLFVPDGNLLLLGDSLLVLDLYHIALHRRQEKLVVEAYDIFFTTFSLYLLDNFVVDLFGVAVDLPVLQNYFVELEMHPHNFGKGVGGA